MNEAAKLRMKCGRMVRGGIVRTTLPKPIFAEDGSLLLFKRRFVVVRGKARVLS
jgi:hypothetical protein